MPQNQSVERFKALTEERKRTVHNNAVNELHEQASYLKDIIASVAPVYHGPSLPGVDPGALRASIKVVPDRSKDTVVRIVAGGPTTIHPAGTPYDYARGVEFGTHNMRAEPFFFPTYRLLKKKIIAGMKRRITREITKYSAEK